MTELAAIRRRAYAAYSALDRGGATVPTTERDRAWLALQKAREDEAEFHRLLVLREQHEQPIIHDTDTHHHKSEDTS